LEYWSDGVLNDGITRVGIKEVMEMGKKVIHTDKAPQAIGPYSQAIQAGNFLFLSGQIPLNPKTGEL